MICVIRSFEFQTRVLTPSRRTWGSVWHVGARTQAPLGLGPIRHLGALGAPRGSAISASIGEIAMTFFIPVFWSLFIPLAAVLLWAIVDNVRE